MRAKVHTTLVSQKTWQRTFGYSDYMNGGGTMENLRRNNLFTEWKAVSTFGVLDLSPVNS